MLFNRIFNKVLVSVILAFSLPLVTGVSGIAVKQEESLNELKKRNETLKRSINKAHINIGKFKDIASALSEQISENRDQISIKKEEIESLKKKIECSNEEIKNLNERIEIDFKKLKRRIVSIYKTQELGVVDFIFESDTFDEFLEKMIFVKNIVDRDMSLIEKIKSNIKTLEEKKKDLENERVKLDELIESLEKETKELHETKGVSEVKVSRLEEKEKKLSETFAKNEAEIKRVDEEISLYFKSQVKKQNASSTSSAKKGNNKSFSGSNSSSESASSSGSDYAWPVPGFDYISTPFGWDILFGVRRFHRGIDIAGAGILGKPVVAVADGRVVMVYNTCPHSEGGCSCGGGFGNNVVINHGERRGFIAGSRYGHLSRVCVDVGDDVKKDQIIGYVGTTGFSTGPHVHFELWKNGEQYDPMEEY